MSKLSNAIREGKTELVKQLLAQGEQPRNDDKGNEIHDILRTALSDELKVSMIRLVAPYCDINQGDYGDGWFYLNRPLSLAAQWNNNPFTILALVELGAQPDKSGLDNSPMAKWLVDAYASAKQGALIDEADCMRNVYPGTRVQIANYLKSIL